MLASLTPRNAQNIRFHCVLANFFLFDMFVGEKGSRGRDYPNLYLLPICVHKLCSEPKNASRMLLFINELSQNQDHFKHSVKLCKRPNLYSFPPFSCRTDGVSAPSVRSAVRAFKVQSPALSRATTTISGHWYVVMLNWIRYSLKRIWNEINGRTNRWHFLRRHCIENLENLKTWREHARSSRHPTPFFLGKWSLK